MDSYFCPQLTSTSDYESIQKMLTSWKKSGKGKLVFWTSNQTAQMKPEKKWYGFQKFPFWMYLSETSEAKDGTEVGLRFRVRVIQASNELNDIAEQGNPGIYPYTCVHDKDNSEDAKMWFKCDLVEEFSVGRETNLGFKAAGYSVGNKFAENVASKLIFSVEINQAMPSLVVVQTTGNYSIL